MRLVKEESFKSIHRGKPTGLLTLQNKNGMVVQITNYGAKIVTLIVPDKNNVLDDVVLGYETIEEYINGQVYFGAICGRFANRIAKGKFIINGTEFHLPVNNGPNSLHGGTEGFSSQVFDVIEVKRESVTMNYLSRDGEMGYPGNLTLEVKYLLTDLNELQIDYKAVTDKTTHVNIASHPFFNLAGAGRGDVLKHELIINGEEFTPVDKDLIPSGEIKPVRGTPMDFTKPHSIGERVNDPFEQLTYCRGYDHNWVLSKEKGVLALAATCYEPESGRVMEVLTTQPGLQLYTGNWLDGSDIGKGGKVYGNRSALCLESQHFPDSPNKPEFPSTLLRSDEIYKETCIYKFFVKQGSGVLEKDNEKFKS